MLAAGRAAELGVKVKLLEKTYQVGSKLLMTGGGRCNITNSADIKSFIEAFGADGKGRFLYRALSVFSNKDLISFFAARGLEMRTNPDGKVFPVDDSADSVLAVLRGYIKQHGVTVTHNSAVKEVILTQDKRSAAGVVLINGERLTAKNVVIATGGLSYPKTGSNGNGYAFAKQCGHKIAPLRPALVSLESDDVSIKDLQGVTLKNVLITLVVEGKKKYSQQGDLLFTHFGVSGPKVLILSGDAAEALAAGKQAELSFNFMPQYNPEELDKVLQKEWLACGNKTFKGYLKDLFPESFACAFEKQLGATDGLKCCEIGRAERRRITDKLSDFRVNITKPRPIEEATITRGGVCLNELDPQTMGSKLVKNLYFCGEVIDLDGITGGYNLQEAFSTGYLAGESAGNMERGE